MSGEILTMFIQRFSSVLKEHLSFLTWIACQIF